MVLGYFIATGIETTVEIGFWIIRKTVTGIYYYVYPEEETVELSKNEIDNLKKEISELKDLVKTSN